MDFMLNRGICGNTVHNLIMVHRPNGQELERRNGIMEFQASEYFNQETGRNRWAVYSKTSRTFYFASRYGKKAAQQYVARLNREAI